MTVEFTDEFLWVVGIVALALAYVLAGVLVARMLTRRVQRHNRDGSEYVAGIIFAVGWPLALLIYCCVAEEKQS